MHVSLFLYNMFEVCMYIPWRSSDSLCVVFNVRQYNKHRQKEMRIYYICSWISEYKENKQQSTLSVCWLINKNSMRKDKFAFAG